jgi:hypothetical protein
MLPRRVYLVSGFDPRGPGQLQRLLSRQLIEHGHSRQLDLRPGRRLRGDGWSGFEVLEGAGGRPVLELLLLHWHPVVRREWPRSPLLLLGGGIRRYVRYLRKGLLFKARRQSGSGAFTLFWPCIYGLAAVLFILLLLGLLAALPLAAPLKPPLLLAAATALAWLCWREASRRRIGWLYRSIRYTDRLARGLDGGLETVLANQLEQIRQLEAQAPAAELLLIGHSCGSYVAAMLAARLRRQPAMAPLLPRLRLLTLGQNLVHLAGLPEAASFRRDLACLALAPAIPWLDVRSADDWISSAGCHPYRAAGLPARADYPQVRLVPLLERLGLQGTWARLNHQFVMHFLYFHTTAPAPEAVTPAAAAADEEFNLFDLLLADANPAARPWRRAV